MRPVAALLGLLLLASPGCDWTKEKLGLGRVVTVVEEESHEWVVRKVLEAAAMEPFDAAFAEYVKYLHSDETGSSQSMREWETMRFKALRNKHQCYLRPEEGDPFAFLVMETRENDPEYFQLFVQCKTSDTPTPCHLKRDPGAGGKWRVKFNCLN